MGGVQRDVLEGIRLKDLMRQLPGHILWTPLAVAGSEFQVITIY